MYWDLEARLQSLGFDFTYDKRWYDFLTHRQPAQAQGHLLEHRLTLIGASAHFLENHDEQRIASLLSLPEHRAAALLMLGLPGMRMLHEGQLTGATKRVSVHLGRRPAEPVQPDVVACYEQMLKVLPITSVGQGQATLLRPNLAWADNPTAQNLVLSNGRQHRPRSIWCWSIWPHTRANATRR